VKTLPVGPLDKSGGKVLTGNSVRDE